MTHEAAGRQAEIRALNRHLVSAQDAKILRVVAMVDALPQRGEADALIAPLRPRLAQLRPRRPLTATRLLFEPLDPVLVAAAEWRRGGLTVPRTALSCLARQLAAADPALLEQAAAAIAGATTEDHLAVLRVGAPLWAAAARLLDGAAAPADWAAATGLGEADHAAIRAAIALVLRHAPSIMAQAVRDRPDGEAIAGMLAAADPAAMGVLISVLLHWLPGAAAQVLGITSAHAAPTGLPGRTATERAVEHVLDGIEAEQQAGGDAIAALPRLRRTVAMLDELEAGSIDRPARCARIAATRGRIDAACRGRFDAMLRDKVAARLAALPSAAEEVATLESAARDLRRFEAVARRISGSDHYDRQLRALVGALSPAGGDGAAARVDRLRLAEILLGPEKALGMLAEG